MIACISHQTKALKLNHYNFIGSVYLTFVDIFLKVLKKFSKSCTIVQNKGGLPEFS